MGMLKLAQALDPVSTMQYMRRHWIGRPLMSGCSPDPCCFHCVVPSPLISGWSQAVAVLEEAIPACACALGDAHEQTEQFRQQLKHIRSCPALHWASPDCSVSGAGRAGLHRVLTCPELSSLVCPALPVAQLKYIRSFFC